MNATTKDKTVLELEPMQAETQSKQVAAQTASQHSELSTIMHVVERVAMNPEADMDKLEKLLDMQERVLDRNAKQEYTADLAAMQVDLPRVIEHGRGHNEAKFAKLEDINDTIRPTLHKYGFAATFRVSHENGGLIWITTVLSHKGGHSEETSIPLAPDTSGGKNAVQAMGSTISYGKRYGLCAMLNISTGDDTDGNSPQSGQSELSTKAGDWIAKVNECGTMDALEKSFKDGYKDLDGDKFGRNQLIKAKDATKSKILRGNK